MFIQTEETPNPASMKFLPGRAVMTSGTAHYAQADEATDSPLARRLFAVDGIDGIFLGADFVTVTKADAVDWQVIKPVVFGAIMEHFTSGDPVVAAAAGATEATAAVADDEIVVQIKELLETRVRPAVAQDGGDIVFRSFENGIVYLHMQGACAGCPSSTATLKTGIENMLRHYVPEVSAVEQV